MKERTRNVVVAVTVLVALGFLAGLILLFAGIPEFFRAGYDIQLAFNATHDVQEGMAVHMLGVPIGTITGVGFTDPDDPARGVTFTARVSPEVRIPVDATPIIYSRGVVGSPYVTLETPEDPDAAARTGPPEYLPTDRSVVLEGTFRGRSLLPPKLTDALNKIDNLGEAFNELSATIRSFRTLADNINVAIAPTQPATGTATAPSAPRGLHGTFVRLNSTLDRVESFFADPNAPRDFRKTLANLADATASADAAMKELQAFARKARGAVASAEDVLAEADKTIKGIDPKLDRLTEKLIEDAEGISTVLAEVRKVVVKVNKGEGALGELINNPKLYNSFVDSMEQMDRMIKDLRSLIRKWKDEGVEVKL